MAKNDAKGRCAADWGIVDDYRLTVPSDVTDCLTWFTPKQKMAVSIDLSRRGMIIIRNLADVVPLLSDRRQIMLEEREDDEDAQRRVALSYHFFRSATFVVPERRIRLRSVILDHLGISVTGRLFCLGFWGRIEAYNESSAEDLFSRFSGDIGSALAQMDLDSPPKGE